MDLFICPFQGSRVWTGRTTLGFSLPEAPDWADSRLSAGEIVPWHCQSTGIMAYNVAVSHGSKWSTPHSVLVVTLIY